MSMTMVPASLLLVVGIVYGVEEGKEVKEMVGLLACPEREGGAGAVVHSSSYTSAVTLFRWKRGRSPNEALSHKCVHG